MTVPILNKARIALGTADTGDSHYKNNVQATVTIKTWYNYH